ncbi:hypothetical protein M0802_011369 [Mischocyttarus mexicanus]|nr:hypothetical protein M0802_011369 [Mischocyttarus mexicanus]
MEALGLCPHDPRHNSTAVFVEGQLYAATVADFTGGAPLILRDKIRTERSDLNQLNGPNFVSSFAYEDYVFFFYRETAVEYMNCGKVSHRYLFFLKKNIQVEKKVEIKVDVEEEEEEEDEVESRCIRGSVESASMTKAVLMLSATDGRAF